MAHPNRTENASSTLIDSPLHIPVVTMDSTQVLRTALLLNIPLLTCCQQLPVATIAITEAIANFSQGKPRIKRKTNIAKKMGAVAKNNLHEAKKEITHRGYTPRERKRKAIEAANAYSKAIRMEGDNRAELNQLVRAVWNAESEHYKLLKEVECSSVSALQPTGLMTAPLQDSVSPLPSSPARSSASRTPLYSAAPSVGARNLPGSMAYSPARNTKHQSLTPPSIPTPQRPLLPRLPTETQVTISAAERREAAT